MLTNRNDILGRLKRARDEQELAALLAEAAMFSNINPKTTRRLKRIADRRRDELEDLK